MEGGRKKRRGSEDEEPVILRLICVGEREGERESERERERAATDSWSRISV